ncbi:MAG: hypothetical protein AAGE80_04190 [Pseudomonadota bacterium]
MSLRLTRKQLFAASRYLEIRLDEAFGDGQETFDKDTYNLVQSAIEKTQKAMHTAMDLEARLRAQRASVPSAVINLEEARAEIESRLARLAA